MAIVSAVLASRSTALLATAARRLSIVHSGMLGLGSWPVTEWARPKFSSPALLALIITVVLSTSTASIGCPPPTNVVELLDHRERSGSSVSTRLFQAVRARSSGDVASLLREGADPNTQINGTPVLFYAVQGKDYKSTKILVEGGANVNSVGNDPMPFCLRFPHSATALELAVRNRDYRLVDLLVSAGANVSGGIVSIASWGDSVRILSRLLEVNVDLNEIAADDEIPWRTLRTAEVLKR